MATLNSNFSTPTDYTFDDTLIEVSGSEVKLKLINDIKAFTQNYSSDTGFTYNSSVSEFSAGVLKQKDLLPTNATCWAKFSADTNLNYGGGTLTGTVEGSTLPTIDAEFLKFTNISGQQVSYSATGNFVQQQSGSFKFIVRPQYAGSPSSNQILVSISEDNADTTNTIMLIHETSGNLRVYFYDESDVLSNHIFGAWSPSFANDYEIEFNFDVTTGSQTIFIDGVKTGTDGTLTLTRSSAIGLIRVGADSGGADAPNFWIKNLIFFNTVQHTADYTAGYTLPDNRYIADEITLPVFTYPGLGTLQSFRTFSQVATGNVVYNVNSLYWNGSTWIHSDGTIGQMNDSTTINTNIAALPASETVIIKARTSNSLTQMSFDNLEMYYNGQIYPTSNPTIEPVSTFNMEKLEGFVETAIKTGTDELKYVLRTNGGYVWFDGANWVTSNESYLEANTATEISTNMAAFTSENITFNFRMFLHSADGSTTPSAQNIEISYDFAGEPEGSIHTTSIYFYSRYPDNTVDTTPYKAVCSEPYVKYKTNTLIHVKDVEVIPEATGYTEFKLVDNINMVGLQDQTEITYSIYQGTEHIARILVPVQTGVLLWDILK